MRFLADEGVDRQIVEQLRREGHEVTYVAELAPGIDDDEILWRAHAAGALLITADKDFGELVFRLGRATQGVLLLRLAGLPPKRKARVVASVVKHRADELAGAFSVIAPGGVRIRPKPS